MVWASDKRRSNRSAAGVCAHLERQNYTFCQAFFGPPNASFPSSPGRPRGWPRSTRVILASWNWGAGSPNCGCWNRIELLVSTIEIELKINSIYIFWNRIELNQDNFRFQKLKSNRIAKKSNIILLCQELLFLEPNYQNYYRFSY